ncbi:MAG: hypothetical protein ACPLZB_06650 [Caldisericaceae bacterium]
MKKVYLIIVLFAVSFLIVAPVVLADSGNPLITLEPEWLAGLVGVIAPLIVHWIVGANISRKWKSLFAILVSSVIGFASAFLSGQFNTVSVLQSIAVAFSISQVFYDQFFKDLFNDKEDISNEWR